jgi:hypothetical protein
VGVRQQPGPHSLDTGRKLSHMNFPTSSKTPEGVL